MLYRGTEIWQAPDKVPPLNTSPWSLLVIFPYHFDFFIVAWTFRSREKFVPSPDFESWISKWINALKAFLGKKVKEHCASPLHCTKRRSRRMCTHLLLWKLQNYNSLLNNCQQENAGSQQKKIYPSSKGKGGAKEKLQQDARMGKIAFRIKPQRHSEGSNKTLCTPGDPQRLSQTCLLEFEGLLQRYGSAVACHRDRGSGCNSPECGLSPLGGGHD